VNEQQRRHTGPRPRIQSIRFASESESGFTTNPNLDSIIRTRPCSRSGSIHCSIAISLLRISPRSRRSGLVRRHRHDLGCCPAGRSAAAAATGRRSDGTGLFIVRLRATAASSNSSASATHTTHIDPRTDRPTAPRSVPSRPDSVRGHLFSRTLYVSK